MRRFSSTNAAPSLTKVFITEASSAVAVAVMEALELADTPAIGTSSTSTYISTCTQNKSRKPLARVWEHSIGLRAGCTFHVYSTHMSNFLRERYAAEQL